MAYKRKHQQTTCRVCDNKLPKGRWAYCTMDCLMKARKRIAMRARELWKAEQASILPTRECAATDCVAVFAPTKHDNAMYCSSRCRHRQNKRGQRAARRVAQAGGEG